MKNTIDVHSKNSSKATFKKAAFILKKGGLVAFPTETVYGLGANAFDAKAVKKIFKAKGRPSDNPLIVHIAEQKDLSKVARQIPENALKLMKAFWPGPLTLVLPKHPQIPFDVTAGSDTVAVRMPAHPIARTLLKIVGFPIAAPSANLAGKPSPTDAAHVAEDLQDRIDLILDGGKTKIGLESTVVDATGEKIIILRLGQVTAEDLKKILGYKPRLVQAKTGGPVKSPGLKYKHYAPEAKLVLFKLKSPQKMINRLQKELLKLKKKGFRVGVLCCQENKKFYREADEIISCGPSQHLKKVAQNLFHCLRKFNQTHVDVILAENFTEKEIGKAIMDRLKRSASKIISSYS